MARFDFFNESYDKDFIENTIIDGDISNFKQDKEFLDFLLQWLFLEEFFGMEVNDKYKNYRKYDGILNFIRLDQYNILDKKLYKIYEICGKDKEKFIRFCHHVGKGGERFSFSIDEINTNLKLKNPVDFIDETVKVPGVDNIAFDIENGWNPYNLTIDLQDEYNYELKRSLRHRINESIKANGDNVELLEEMIPFSEKEKKKKEEIEKARIKDDYALDINNFYYGKEIVDISKSEICLNIRSVSFFEDTKTLLFNFRVFRSVPTGDYCLLDKYGKLYIPNEILSKNNIEIGPNSPIRKIEIINVLNLFERVIDKLEEDPIANEQELLNMKGIYEILSNNKQISFGELKKYEPIIRNAYEFLFGSIFNDNLDNYKDDDTSYDASKK